MAGDHIPEEQIRLVRQIAGIIHEYREHPDRFVKFELMAGLTFGPDPVSARIRLTPKESDEVFRCKDEELLGHAGSERDAFFDAVDIFAASGTALAWNGAVPSPAFDPVPVMSLNFAHPTFSVDITFRRRGEPDAFKLAMLFVGFDNTGAASIYAGSRQGLVK
jgi:hypothetical protein